MPVCRARQLVVLAYPVYDTRKSLVMGLYGSRDHLGFQHQGVVRCGVEGELEPQRKGRRDGRLCRGHLLDGGQEC